MSLLHIDEAVRSDATLDGVLIPMKTAAGGSIGILVTHEVLDEIGGVPQTTQDYLAICEENRPYFEEIGSKKLEANPNIEPPIRIESQDLVE